MAYDGYLSECTIFFDANGDGVSSATDPATTVHGGTFSLSPSLTAASLGNAYLIPAPRTTPSTTVSSDAASICYDTALQLPNYLPLAAPAPTSCNNLIVISPLTTLLMYGSPFGLTAAGLTTALGLDGNVALGTADVLAVSVG